MNHLNKPIKVIGEQKVETGNKFIDEFAAALGAKVIVTEPVNPTKDEREDYEEFLDEAEGASEIRMKRGLEDETPFMKELREKNKNEEQS
jgi:sugar phosphate isomerase/epimerase